MSSLNSEWHAIGASVRGVGHERVGLPCQDAHEVFLVGKWLVAAVADGAGSAPMAEVGAQTAVGAAVASARALLADPPQSDDDKRWRELGMHVAAAARTAVEEDAAIRAVPTRDLATTLVVVIAGPELAMAVQVGDGCVVVAVDGESPKMLMTPEPSEYVNETVFLVSGETVAARTNIARGAVRHVALLSDGLQPLALRTTDWTPHSGFFSPLFTFAEGAEDGPQAEAELTRFLTSARVRERVDDDLSIIIGARH